MTYARPPHPWSAAEAARLHAIHSPTEYPCACRECRCSSMLTRGSICGFCQRGLHEEGG